MHYIHGSSVTYHAGGKLTLDRFMIFIDDLSTRMPEAIAQFQRRMISGEHQLDPVLDQFPRVLGNLYKHWDPVAANCMVCATLEFISGNGMEGKKEISAMAPSKDAVTWPRFLRAKTGAAPGYSWTVFPIRYHSDMSVYVQAIPDMDDFINLVNDILSSVLFISVYFIAMISDSFL